MSTIHTENKKIIMDFNESIHGATADTIGDIVNRYYHPDVDWKGPQPFNELEGRDALLETFWKPFVAAFPDLEKDVYMHFAGNDPQFADRDWVISSGNYVGTFKNDWLDIPATQGSVWIRYIEFNKVVEGKIAQTFTLIDILDLMRQAGLRFVPALAPEILIPGPATNDGVIMEQADETATQKSFQVVYDMIWKGLESFEDQGMGKMGLERYFDKDFMWYGPCGIGSMRGIRGFETYHQQPFLKAVPDRTTVEDESDRAFFAEGKYCAYIGWAGLTATHTGPDWLGMPATGKHIVMRCADLYRREGDLLVENWVMLDIIDILMQMGVDIFDRLKRRVYTL